MPRNLRNSPPRWLFGGVLLACCACSSEPAPTPSSAGSGGTAAGGGGATGISGGSGGGALGGAAGGAQGGASGGGGVTGASGSGGAGGGGSGGTAGSGGSAGGGVLAGCANNDYPICIDFESGIDAAVWEEGSENAITTDHFAHGTASYHAYPGGAPRLLTTELGPITNVMWGRFYLHLSPGAPGGHGNIIAAHEGGDWYELGWQFNGLMGVWHFSGGENPLRSMPTIVDQWYCVEFIFDGTTQEMPQWFVDGTEVTYYMGEPNNQKPKLITQFDQIDIGFTSYAGLGLNPEPYGNNDPPVMTDMWLDDIAFDVERIGCITQ